MSLRVSRRSAEPSRLVLLVTLRAIEPTIWRRVQVPGTYSLHQLHRVLQMVFGWLDYHLYVYRVGSRSFEAPDPEAEGEDATAVTLGRLGLRKGMRLEYTYDFGDNWIHDIEVEDVFPGETDGEGYLPALLDGERAGPHEDSGGPFRYGERLEAFRDPNHPQHEELRAWAGEHYDPERFDPWLANQNLLLAAAWGAI